jgi:copper homeostasis protein
MIRPRPSNFIYSDSEFSVMKNDILNFRQLADGFVFGILTPAGRVDVERCKVLVNLADGRPCTFHHAFDQAGNLDEALEDVISAGTSGGRGSAVEGVERLGKLVEKARGRVEVIVGGGVRRGNLKWLGERTGGRWVHSSGIVDGGEEGDEVEIGGMVGLLREE